MLFSWSHPWLLLCKNYAVGFSNCPHLLSLLLFYCSIPHGTALGYPLQLLKLTEESRTVPGDSWEVMLMVACSTCTLAHFGWCLVSQAPVGLQPSSSQEKQPRYSGHQAQSCDLSWQEGMNDENNRLGTGVKVQLLKFKKKRALKDFKWMLHAKQWFTHQTNLWAFLTFKC